MAFGKHSALSLAVAAMVVLPPIANAAEPPCLTTAEFSGLASYALPGVITNVTQRCAASLPAGAFLPGNADALTRRYGAQGKLVWPAAKAAFLKLSAGAGPDATAMLGAMPDDALQQVVAMLAAQFAGQKLPVDRCDMIDSVMRSLAPLPLQNIGQLLAVMVSISTSRTRDKAEGDTNARPGRMGKFTICPATAVAQPLLPPPSTVPSAGKP